jgi:hypothetical protein
MLNILFTIKRESKVINLHNSSYEYKFSLGWLTWLIIVAIIGLHFFT